MNTIDRCIYIYISWKTLFSTKPNVQTNPFRIDLPKSTEISRGQVDNLRHQTSQGQDNHSHTPQTTRHIIFFNVNLIEGSFMASFVQYSRGRFEDEPISGLISTGPLKYPWRICLTSGGIEYNNTKLTEMHVSVGKTLINTYLIRLIQCLAIWH